jgi:hypothetical protein
MTIHWGEIVPAKIGTGTGTGTGGKTRDGGTGNAREEHLQRKQNLITIRLLSRSDCPDLDTTSVSRLDLRSGSHVAIIDMRVFVPEVMTVLSTLGQQSFLDGFTRVSFAKYLLSPDDGAASDGTSADISLPPLSPTVSLIEHLVKAFDETTIECIANFSESRKRVVIQKICQLKVVQTLDQTQGEAFVHALMRPLHCTQGPPGTGKVYLYYLSSFCLCHSLTNLSI